MRPLLGELPVSRLSGETIDAFNNAAASASNAGPQSAGSRAGLTTPTWPQAMPILALLDPAALDATAAAFLKAFRDHTGMGR